MECRRIFDISEVFSLSAGRDRLFLRQACRYHRVGRRGRSRGDKRVTELKSIMLVSAIIIWLLLPPAQAIEPVQGDLVHICTASGAQGHPDIDKGRVVWEDSRDGGRYIYRSNTFGGEEERITSEDLEYADQRYPSISGDYIVWQDWRHGNSEIYLYSPLDGEKRITNSTSDQQMPVICGDHIVWYDTRQGRVDVCLYDIGSGQEIYLGCSPVIEWKPALSDDYVVWEEDTGGGDIWIYDIQTREKRAITQNSARQTYPAISGRLIAWEDYRNGWPDIYLFNLDADREQKITDNPAAQVSPAISGDVLVWEDKRSGTWEIYICDLVRGTKIQMPLAPTGREQIYPAISDEQIVWQNDRDARSDIYAFAYARGMPPIAEFSVEPGAGTVPLSVAFRDRSGGDPNTWKWDFGDEKSSNEQNPHHIYNEPGEYTVSLTVSNRFGSDTITKTSLINATSTTESSLAHFTANVTRGAAPLRVSFNEESSGKPTSWHWDFGDGMSSTDQNPEHTYIKSGTYNVTLTCKNAVGSSTYTRRSYITVLEPLKANFSADIREGLGPLTVVFRDRSNDDVDYWEWDFGDGGSSNEQNPTHTYQSTGTYTVRLTATGDAGRDMSEKVGYITVTSILEPTASFTANVTRGAAPLAVQFLDTSTGNLSSRSWDFGDGKISAEKNPVHIFMRPGTYTVNLTVEGGGDHSTKTTQIQVQIPGPPIAGFDAAPYNGTAPLKVKFTDASTGSPTSWFWDFGDGMSSYEQNPIHTYKIAGNYTVNLTVKNRAGTSTAVREDYISIDPASPGTTSPSTGSSDRGGGGGGGSGGGASGSSSPSGGPPHTEWTSEPTETNITDTTILDDSHKGEVRISSGPAHLIIVERAEGQNDEEIIIKVPGLDDMPPAPDKHIFTGYACTIGPEGLAFVSPATLAFNFTTGEWSTLYSGQEGLTLHYYDRSTGIWEGIPTDIHLGTRSVAGGITCPGLYAIFARAPHDGVGEDVEEVGGESDPIYMHLIPGLFALVIVAVSIFVYLRRSGP